MHGNVRNVSRKIDRLTESVARNIISKAVTRVRSRHSLKTIDLAERIGCEKGTIENAEDGAHLMRLTNLFNLLTVDEHALEGLLGHFDRRSVPITAKCDTDALTTTGAAIHKLTQAFSPASDDGMRITDAECLGMEAEIRAAWEATGSLLTRCEEIRKRRAA